MPAPANLVGDSTTSTGTGNLTLAQVSGLNRFSTAFGTGSTTNVFDYFISHRTANEWERGTGHMSDANTLVRDTVIESSNANAAVSFSAGTKDAANDIPALNQCRLDAEGQALTGGCAVTEKDLGTVSSGTTTLSMGARPLQKLTNNGAFTLAPGATVGSCLLSITNGASAGAITTSGWSKVAGDAFTTTNGNKFVCHCSVGAAGSLLNVMAMQ